jgi:hypothetical protein
MYWHVVVSGMEGNREVQYVESWKPGTKFLKLPSMVAYMRAS